MMKLTQLPSKFKIVDTSSNLLFHDILFPFAFDEMCCREVGNGNADPLIHIWRHPSAFVMGLRDRKLPNALEAMNWLESLGYSVSVRNSGGAAVPLDLGVVNISVILPNMRGKLEFRQDFEFLYVMIQESLKRVFSKVEKGEILGSYCPGEFDLSIGGKKFCGIAQRRQTKACVVQAFLLVEGDGESRGKLVQEFYQRASGGSVNFDYPIVKPDRMTTLSELNSVLSSDMLVVYFKEYLKTCGQVSETNNYNIANSTEIEKTILNLRQRYEKRLSKNVGF